MTGLTDRHPRQLMHFFNICIYLEISFLNLIHDNPEHRLIRKQFLFVDQYFEAIDRRIHELAQN